MKNLTQAALVAVFLMFSLTGCGGGGGSSNDSASEQNPPANPAPSPENPTPPPENQTTFTVTVDAPGKFLTAKHDSSGADFIDALISGIVPKAYADIVDNASIKAVTVSERGIVTDTLSITVVSIGNGIYEVSPQSTPRSDLLFIAELPGQTVNLEAGKTIPDNALLVLGYDNNIRLDAASTVATRLLFEYIDSFTELTLNEISDLIDTIDRSQIDSFASNSADLSSFLLQAETESQNLISQQIAQHNQASASLEELSQSSGSYGLSNFSIASGAGYGRSTFGYRHANNRPGTIQINNNALSLSLGASEEFLGSVYIRDILSISSDTNEIEQDNTGYDIWLNTDNSYSVFFPEERREVESALDRTDKRLEIDNPSILTLEPIVDGSYMGILNKIKRTHLINDGKTDFSGIYDLEIEKSFVFMNKQDTDFSGNISDSYGVFSFGLSLINDSDSNSLNQILALTSYGLIDITGSSTNEDSSTYSYESRIATFIASSTLAAFSLLPLGSLGNEVNENGTFTTLKTGSALFDTENSLDRMQFSSNGQFFWRTATQTVDDSNDQKASAISIGLKKANDTTINDLSDKTFMAKGLSFSTDTNFEASENTYSDLDTADLSVVKISFSENNIIIKGSRNYTAINTKDGAIEVSSSPFEYTIPITFDNGAFIGEVLQDNGIVVLITGVVGTDEDNITGPDALLLTVIEVRDDIEVIEGERVIRNDIRHSILMATPK
ncbi:MAG: hypothetical protein ACR2PX_08370 [Endozoicomonas sp.]|uniref:hypothetical protein n=1 Tax=Endozoicomonas sp. TaxID=1892382 RepID=UPI003D9B8F03